jgi:hypothetical protein
MTKFILLALINRHFDFLLKKVEKYELNREDFTGLNAFLKFMDNVIYRMYLTFTLPIYDFCTRSK